MAERARTPIPIRTQVEVFFRDRWLCSLCERPTIFPLTLKRLDALVAHALPHTLRAYWNPQWRRDAAPLLDELAACVDHVEAFAKGGAHAIANFATACARCNARKSARTREAYLAANPPWKVKAKHGPPKHWDGLAAVFVTLAKEPGASLTPIERAWLQALEDHFAGSRVR